MTPRACSDRQPAARGSGPTQGSGHSALRSCRFSCSFMVWAAGHPRAAVSRCRAGAANRAPTDGLFAGPIHGRSLVSSAERPEVGSAGAGQRGKGGRSRCAATWAVAPVDVLEALTAPAVRRDQVRLAATGRMGARCQGDRVHPAHRLGWSWPPWPCKDSRAPCLQPAVRPLSVTEVGRTTRAEMTC